MHFNPKLSIVTVVYNAQPLIERTIKSIIAQTYINIEYIIIDGGSDDGTLELAEQYQSQIALILSGRDNGLYDAMNKGLKNATGDYIMFLNAGDELYDKDTITRIFASSVNADVYYGNTLVVTEDGKALGDRRLKPPAQLNWKSLKYGMCVSHQSFIAKRLLCDFYNLEYSIAADIDWVINVLKQADKTTYTGGYISRYLAGGTSHRNKQSAWAERFRIMAKHYGFVQTLWNHVYIVVRFPFHKATKKTMT